MLQGHGQFNFRNDIMPLLTLLQVKELQGLTQTAWYEPVEKPRSKTFDFASYVQDALKSSDGSLLQL